MCRPGMCRLCGEESGPDILTTVGDMYLAVEECWCCLSHKGTKKLHGQKPMYISPTRGVVQNRPDVHFKCKQALLK